MSAELEAILTTPPDPGGGDVIGTSREGRPIRAFRIGDGPEHVSLVGGCHADEPVGPRLLRHLAPWLAGLPADHPHRVGRSWWIIPHLNPDGEARNRVWYDDTDETYDVARFLAGQDREPPGDDVEFCFPRSADDDGARPENRAAWAWWRGADGPFALHCTLHGMGFAAGPWFLVDRAWRDRMDVLAEHCVRRVTALGYHLHDVDRRGEKGFERLRRGFSTRPESDAMRAHFLAQGDEETAATFRPNSMETIRSFGGDPLTLVSEMPLFLTPGVGRILGPPDPIAEQWKERVADWRARLAGGADPETVRREAREHGLLPMPVRDQMDLQWTLIRAGLAQVQAARP